MKCKELCMDLITEYVISTRRIFGGSTRRIFGGESENVMLYGMIIGLLIGLEEHEDVTALKVLRNEVFKRL